jgi:large-conductance mechanosensitive channel
MSNKQFIKQLKLLTVTVIGSFITLKLINALHDYLYEPIVSSSVKKKDADKWFIKIGPNLIPASQLVDIIIRYMVFIIVLLIIFIIINKEYKIGQLCSSCEMDKYLHHTGMYSMGCTNGRDSYHHTGELFGPEVGVELIE